jgi:ribose transport system permease protein
MRSRLSRLSRQGAPGAILTFALLLAIDIVLKGGRFSGFDVQTLCMNALPLVLVSLGQLFVVLTNGIDLSLGPIMSVTGAIAALTFTHSAVLAVVLSLGAAALAGLLNAILVVRLRLPSILGTLATMSIYQGIALVILPSPGGAIPAGLTTFMTMGGIGLASTPLLLLLVAMAVTGWIMTTPFGLWLRAVGGDRSAARSSAVPVTTVTFGAYVLAAVFAGLGGLYLSIATANGSPTIGDSFILLSVAAVVLGGVSVVGGRGSPIGTVMGALTLTIIGSLLYFANLSSFFQSLINGVILVAVVGFAAVKRRIIRLGGGAPA